MSDYRRNFVPGGTFFFTVVTGDRRPWLCTEPARQALREVFAEVRRARPFSVDAMVLLPDHLHCIWTLPPGDGDFSTRWRLIKAGVTRRCPDLIRRGSGNTSRRRQRERGLWQRRFWEHTVRDEEDFRAHCDYVHFNPVKHGLSASPAAWAYSSFARFVREGRYPPGWGAGKEPALPEGIGGE